jgi:hypothetical protein
MGRTVGRRLRDDSSELAGDQIDRHVQILVLDVRMREPLVVGLANRMQDQPMAGRREDRPVLRHLGPVRLAAVVEPGGDLDFVAHPATQALQDAHQSVVAGGGAPGWGHEVDDLVQPGLLWRASPRSDDFSPPAGLSGPAAVVRPGYRRPLDRAVRAAGRRLRREFIPSG